MAQKRSTDGYGSRLERALQEGPRPLTVRQFARELKARYPKLRGTSAGGVREYVKGSITSPRMELLQAMADVLDVRRDWLAFNQGAMTEAEEHARMQVGAVARGRVRDMDPHPTDLEAAFLAGLPALENAGPASWHVVGELYALYTRSRFAEIMRPLLRAHVDRRARGEEPSPSFNDLADTGKGELTARAKRVGEMVAAGAKSAGVDLAVLSPWEIDRYVQTSVQALSILFRPASPAELRAGHTSIRPADTAPKKGAKAKGQKKGTKRK